MVEDGNVREVITAFNLHAGVDPQSRLSLRFFIVLPRGIHYASFDAFTPRHAEKKSAVFIFPNGHICFRLAPPLQVKEISFI
jgi:hypothetical protein